MLKLFWEKYPVELKDSVALSMIHDAMETAHEKCEMGDENYIKYLVKSYGMIEDYMEEKQIDPSAYPMP